jgi:2-polyprenyl-6-methoxyphenol hydroxylase-like FAD-dependent oxidoreductase
MGSARRALIIGGSLAGLFAAHLLRSIGWEVDAFERNSGDLAGRGAGIGTHDALIAIAQRIGLSFASANGVATKSYACIEQDGRLLDEVPLKRVMSAWGVIYRPLKELLPTECHHSGCALVAVKSNGDRVTAIFADGSQASGDLLIAADGFRSTVREQFLPDRQPRYAGYVAWRAMVGEHDIPSATAAELFDRLTFCVPSGEIVVSYPVPANDCGRSDGQRAYNIVWYRPVDIDTLADLSIDIHGRRHDGALPPGLIRPQIVNKIKAEASARLPRIIADIFARADLPFFHPIYDLASPQLVFGRVALVGDAAFVARPHVGAGVTKAALDAACLADALVAADADLDLALAQYDLERRRFGDWLVARGRAMSAWIGQPARGQVMGQERQIAVMRQYVSMALDIKGEFLGRAGASEASGSAAQSGRASG